MTIDEKLLPTTIIEQLERNGALKFDDLLKQVQKRYDGLNESELNTMLMKMEIQGLIRVYRIPKGKRRIELA
jgi:DNA-binding HxlR family transcriptional regulator